jgi:TolB protein
VKQARILSLISTFFIIAFSVSALLPGVACAQLVLNGTETRVTDAAADQFDPAISSNLVVYTDFSGVDADVWYTDLADGTAHPVVTGAGDQQLTGVSGSRVVYTDWNTMDVLVKDVNAGITQNLTNSAGSNSLDPAISGDLVAWTDDRDGNTEIYAKDLATGEERRISNNSLVDEAPAVGNGIIVWESCDGYACDIYAYDWATKTTRQLTSTPYASERFPDVYGRTVVYQREQGTPIDKNIAAFDLDSNMEIELSLPGDQENAHISGRVVSFNDSASGVPHIGLWDLASGYHFNVPGSESGQYLNDIDGNRVVYSDNRAGTLDIYMYTFQIENVQGEQIENVLQFFDDSAAGGTLVGDGPGKSAANRLKALRNMLEAAAELIRIGDFEGARRQLSDAYLKTDGLPQPPDFVKGPAAVQLAALIRDLVESL